MSPKEAIFSRVRAKRQVFMGMESIGHSEPWLRKPKNTVLRLGPNTLGRDFVVSDIHGCFSLLFDAMASVDFNPQYDRLLCTGDLIDRGPESHMALKFLNLPYVHSVKGNHEDMFCSLDPDNLRSLAKLNCNGLRWAEKLSNEEIEGSATCIL